MANQPASSQLTLSKQYRNTVKELGVTPLYTAAWFKLMKQAKEIRRQIGRMSFDTMSRNLPYYSNAQ
jgi:hypothetical protein